MSGTSFADGVRYRIEIPSVEGPVAFAAVLEEATAREVAVRRISQGSGVMMLGSPPEDVLGFSIYVWVEDLEAHYARARAAGAEIVRPLADTSYGTREYGARDLDGHLWYFGTYRPE